MLVQAAAGLGTVLSGVSVVPLCTELLADLAPSFLNDTKKHAQFWKLQNESYSLMCFIARMAPRRDQAWGQSHRVRRFSAIGHFTCGSLNFLEVAR